MELTRRGLFGLIVGAVAAIAAKTLPSPVEREPVSHLAFQYVPDPNVWATGYITNVRINGVDVDPSTVMQVCRDGKTWTMLKNGEPVYLNEQIRLSWHG